MLPWLPNKCKLWQLYNSRMFYILADFLVIRIPARLKTSEVERFQPLLSFKPFLDRPELYCFISQILYRHYSQSPARRLWLALYFVSCSAQSVSSYTLRALGQNNIRDSGSRYKHFFYHTLLVMLRHLSQQVKALV